MQGHQFHPETPQRWWGGCSSSSGHIAHSSLPYTANLVCPVCGRFLNMVCPVPKGFSTSCDHLTVCCSGSASGTHFFGSLVWKTLVCVCVCACLKAHPACVCAYKPLWCIAAVWEGERIQTGDAPSLVPCIQTKCLWCLLCAIPTTPCSSWIPFQSWFLLSARNVWLVNCWVCSVLGALSPCFPPLGSHVGSLH